VSVSAQKLCFKLQKRLALRFVPSSTTTVVIETMDNTRVPAAWAQSSTSCVIQDGAAIKYSFCPSLTSNIYLILSTTFIFSDMCYPITEQTKLLSDTIRLSPRIGINCHSIFEAKCRFLPAKDLLFLVGFQALRYLSPSFPGGWLSLPQIKISVWWCAR